MTAWNWREVVPPKQTWYVFPAWDRLGVDLRGQYDHETHQNFLGMSEQTYHRVRDAARLERNLHVDVETHFVESGATEMQIALPPEMRAFVGIPEAPFDPVRVRTIVLSPQGKKPMLFGRPK